jgi:hypothetical protein
MITLTTSEITAAASAALLDGGYRIVETFPRDISSPSGTRFFEDAFGVVEIAVFESWQGLREGWPNAQGALVELMSRYVKTGEPKAWEGYLVLFTPATLPDASRDEAEQIKYDTSRLRKLLATGDDLRTITDVERAVLPLLPITPALAQQMAQEDQVFELLPQMLAKRGVSSELARELIAAFLANEPLMERLHGVKS